MEKVIEKLKLMEMEEIPLTQERIDSLMSTHYTSGRKIEVGDKMLFALIKEESKITDEEIKLISFHIDEIGVLYELDKVYNERNTNNKLIYLTKI